MLLHGLTATHRYVVMGSRALERAGHRRHRLRRARPRRLAPAPAPDAYGYERPRRATSSRVLDDRGIERAVLAGASMGAHTALRLALEQPERVAGLVVITPAYDPADARRRASLARWDALSDGLRSGRSRGLRRGLRRAGGRPSWRETVAQGHPPAAGRARAPGGGRRRAARGPALARRSSALERAGRDRVPDGRRRRPRRGRPRPPAGGRRGATRRRSPARGSSSRSRASSPIAWQGGQLSRVIARARASEAASA